MTLPLVSIAVPAYNHAAFIEECLSSVCAQTYPELELVLIDDGLSDATFEIAQSFVEARRDRFRRVVLERRLNQGVSANSNACIAACRGEWVHLLGSDDVLYPNKVERIQQTIVELNRPDLALVHADIDYVDQYGEPVRPSKELGRPDAGIQCQAYRDLFLEAYYVFNPTVALHRDKFLSIGGFDKTLPLEDLDCWLRLAVEFGFARVPEVLASYRKHPGNTSRKRTMMLAAQLQTYSKFLSSNPGRISDDDIRWHFRRKLRRFWRRTRKQRPLFCPLIAFSALKSYVKTPTAIDYLNFANLLRRIA